MNIVDSCLDKYANTDTDKKAAILWEGEEGQTRRLSYSELRREVNRMANPPFATGRLIQLFFDFQVRDS